MATTVVEEMESIFTVRDFETGNLWRPYPALAISHKQAADANELALLAGYKIGFSYSSEGIEGHPFSEQDVDIIRPALFGARVVVEDDGVDEALAILFATPFADAFRVVSQLVEEFTDKGLAAEHEYLIHFAVGFVRGVLDRQGKQI